jgi:saccharopine dehydrogenase (NAD+, L-lysine-forming)
LGGYGHTGRLIAHYLLLETTLEILLAGRNRQKALEQAALLNDSFPGTRVTGVYADAADSATLRQVFDEVSLVVVASSTAVYTENVAGVAIQTGIDYLDVQYSTHKLAILRHLSAEIKSSGCCFITDGGFHPGLPAALIHFLASEFDKVYSAIVGSVIKIDWSSLDVSVDTMVEFVSEFKEFDDRIYRDGRWQRAGWKALFNPPRMDYGQPFGRQYGMPMYLEELRAIPELYSEIKETAFYVGGMNWFVDWLLGPIIMLGLRLSPQKSLRPLGRLMYWGLQTFSSPPYGTVLKAEAHGERDGQILSLNMTIAHEDGYAFTAIPVVACLLQVLDGSIRKPGLWLQANVVEPRRLLNDMERMGVEIRSRKV